MILPYILQHNACFNIAELGQDLDHRQGRVIDGGKENHQDLGPENENENDKEDVRENNVNEKEGIVNAKKGNGSESVSEKENVVMKKDVENEKDRENEKEEKENTVNENEEKKKKESLEL